MNLLSGSRAFQTAVQCATLAQDKVNGYVPWAGFDAVDDLEIVHDCDQERTRCLRTGATS